MRTPIIVFHLYKKKSEKKIICNQKYVYLMSGVS